jgi:hypothetical protein
LTLVDLILRLPQLPLTSHRQLELDLAIHTNDRQLTFQSSDRSPSSRP